MDDHSPHVRTIYSHKKHGSKVPQVLKSQQIFVQPKSVDKFDSGSSYGRSHEQDSNSAQRRHYPDRGISSNYPLGSNSSSVGTTYRPEVPPRISQLRSNVYAGDSSNSGDYGHGSTSRSIPTFVPRIPELSPNSFSRSWQKQEDERSLHNGLGDGLRQDPDFIGAEYPEPKVPASVSEDLHPKREESKIVPRISETGGAGEVPKVPKRQSLPTPLPDQSIEERLPTPEEEIILHSGPKSSESSPAISESTSEESVSLLEKNNNRKMLIDLFAVQNLDTVDTSRFEEDLDAGKMFYTALDAKGGFGFRLNQINIQNDLKSFAVIPVPLGITVKCRITRDKRGLDRNMYPNYHMHIEIGDGLRILILTARKRKKSTTTNYLISVDPTDLTRYGDSYIGKVRSNLMGTHFTIYDNGNSPKHYNYHSLALDTWKYREELGDINYDSGILGFQGPRKMRIFIPAMMNESQRLEIRPEGTQDSITELVKRDELRGIKELRNKTPVWDPKTKAYCLNFKGRVTRTSVKNFQIINQENDEYTILQFGRIEEDCFTLDFSYPLCPLQAFAIALSSFDVKLSCE